MATGAPKCVKILLLLPLNSTICGEITFFQFLWSSSGQNYTLNFVDATWKYKNRRTSENTILLFLGIQTLLNNCLMNRCMTFSLKLYFLTSFESVDDIYSIRDFLLGKIFFLAIRQDVKFADSFATFYCCGTSVCILQFLHKFQLSAHRTVVPKVNKFVYWSK